MRGDIIASIDAADSKVRKPLGFVAGGDAELSVDGAADTNRYPQGL